MVRFSEAEEEHAAERIKEMMAFEHEHAVEHNISKDVKAETPKCQAQVFMPSSQFLRCH